MPDGKPDLSGLWRAADKMGRAAKIRGDMVGD
jgi:hypothetical protein